MCVCFVSEEDNLQGWFFAEDDGNQIKKQKHPLLLRQMPVVMSKLQEFKVRPFLTWEQRRYEHIRRSSHYRGQVEKYGWREVVV